MYIGPEWIKRGDRKEGKGNDKSDNEKQGMAGSMSQMVVGVRGIVYSRSRQPFVDRSCAQVLKRCVLLSKGRRSFQHVLRPNGGPHLFTGRGASSVTGVISVGLPQPPIAPSVAYSLSLFTEAFSGRL